MKITFLGSGDAFGSGGRFNTCILLELEHGKCLLDCGASSLIAMRKYRINPNEISTIFITHLHGDHFGGIPFFILDAQMVSKRTAPLTIAGPLGTRQRILDLMEVMFPGSSKTTQKFTLDILEMDTESLLQINGIEVISYPVSHPSGSPSTALRLTVEGKVIAYTGDTEWVASLVSVAREADLLITEACFFDEKIKYHLDFQTIMAHREELQAKRLVLTHMGQIMLQRLRDIDCEYADDGKVIEIV